MREKRKEYGSGSDKSGSVDQFEAGKDVRAIGTSVMSSAVNPALIVDYKMVSLRLNAYGLGGTKVLKRSTRMLNRRMTSERRKRRPPPIQA